MKNSVFRPSIDLHELLLITKHCIEQREKLTQQRARLSAQQRTLREVQSKSIRSVITAGPVMRIQKLETVSEVVWSLRSPDCEIEWKRLYGTGATILNFHSAKELSARSDTIQCKAYTVYSSLRVHLSTSGRD